ncbi:MAG: hypothetical protein AB1782_10575 [Cyanobacteriota bacterium]
MIVSRIKGNNLCKPAGIGKDDSSSRRVADDVGEQMTQNGQNGMTQIETQPGDTLESVAKGHLQGSGQKVDLGNLLFEQRNILHQNWDQIQGNMKNKSNNPKDLMTFRGMELPQGIKINLNETHTQYSNTPTNPVERSTLDPSQRPNGANETDNTTSDAAEAQNDSNNDSYAGAGVISNTGYALELHNVGLSDEVKQGMNKYMNKNKIF